MSRRAIVLAVVAIVVLPALAPSAVALPLLPAGPSASFSYAPDEGIRAATVVTFSSQASSPLPLLRVSWSYATVDGPATAEGSTLEVVFGAPGSYTVTHRATDLLGRVAEETQVVSVVSSPPRADFMVEPVVAARGVPVAFSDLSTDEDGDAIVGHAWDFGDGTVAEDAADVTHAYAALGSFPVTLTVEDATGGMGSATRIVRIVNVAPTVTASASPTRPVVGQAVTFTATGVDPDVPGGALTYTWSFSDGVVVEGETVARSFPAGNFTATVRATDADGGASDPSVLTLTVERARPMAAFTFAPETPRAGETVLFRDASASPNGPIVRWHWSVAGQLWSTRQDPAYAFQQPGTYTVRLEVADAAGLVAVATRTITVTA